MMDDLSKPASNGGVFRIKPGFMAAMAAARQDVLERMLAGGAVVSAIGMLLRLIGVDLLGALVYGAAAAAFIILRKQGQWTLRLRTLIFLLFLYLFALLNLVRSGIGGTGMLYLVVLPPLVILLVGNRAGVVAIALSVLTWLGAGLAFQSIEILLLIPESTSFMDWVYGGTDLLLILVLLVVLQQQLHKTQSYLVTHAQQLAAVADVGRAVTSSLDLQTLLNSLAELLRRSFGFFGVNVWLLTEPPEMVRLEAGFNPDGDDLGPLDLTLPMVVENSVTAVCRTGEHRLVNNIVSPEGVISLDEFSKARSQLVLPLKIAAKIVGALEILSDQPGAFSADDVVLLRSVADQVTIAIRNATLYEGERARRHLAETLYEVGRALSRTLNLDEVLGLILQQLEAIVPSDRAAVMLLEGDELQYKAVRGFPDSFQISNVREPVKAGGIYGNIIGSRKPMAIPDVINHPDWEHMEGLPPARSWMGVPLLQVDRVIGLLSMTRDALDPFSVSEMTLSQTFASQAAIALENARLYEDLELFNQALEEMVAERTAELQLAYDQLERLDRTKSDFIRVTSHELRTPLTILSGYIQMLQAEVDVIANPSLAQLVEGFNSGAVRMHQIVNSMLDIAKIDSSALELSKEPLSLAFLIKNVAGNFESSLLQRDLSLVLKDLNTLPPIEADSGALNKVFYHLIGNAIKYTPDGGTITVSGLGLAPQEEFPEGGVEIVISDTGIGIDPASQELIFTKFYQTGEVSLHSSGRTKFKGGGPGLGLPIARGIVQAHQGKMWVQSTGYDEENCPGSHFHVMLPLRQRVAVRD